MPTFSVTLQDAIDENAVVELQLGSYIPGNNGEKGDKGDKGDTGDVTPAALAAQAAAEAAQSAAELAADNAAASAADANGVRADIANTSDPAKGDALVGVKRTATGAGATTAHAWIEAQELNVKADFLASGNGSSDDYAKIQAALNVANVAGSATVIVPPGIYSISQQLRVYSNTRFLILPGATIRRDYNSSPTGVGVIGLQTGAKNVTFTGGGAIDCNGQNFTQSSGCVTGVDCENVTFDGVSFLNVVDFHATDFQNTKRYTARNCKFLGFANKSGTRAFSEAIQTDPSLSGSPISQDWVIDGCYFGPNPDNLDPDFGSWGAGIGNHASIDNSVFSRISITNCTFNGCGYAGIRPFAWDDVTISGNKFINCAIGIYAGMYNGAVPRANTDFEIIGNQFIGTTGANVIFFDDDSAGAAPSSGIAIVGNAFRNSSASIAARIQAATDVTVSSNTAKGCLGFVNLDTCNFVAINGNTVNDITSTGVFVGAGAGADVAISGNIFRKITGARAVHINAAYNGVIVANNVISDCSGVTAISADSACSNITIDCNTIKAGPLALVPTGNAIVTSASVINVEVIDNLIGSGVPVPSVQSTAGTGVFVGNVTNTPEAAIIAPVGSLARRRNGGAATTLYAKESGNGVNTGWVAK